MPSTGATRTTKSKRTRTFPLHFLGAEGGREGHFGHGNGLGPEPGFLTLESARVERARRGLRLELLQPLGPHGDAGPDAIDGRCHSFCTLGWGGWKGEGGLVAAEVGGRALRKRV